MKIFIIGRENSTKQVDIRIPKQEDTVGREHLKLTVESNNKYLLTDLGSKNGTEIKENGYWVSFSQGYVEPSDILKLGEYTTTLQALIDQMPTEPTPPEATGKRKFDPETGEIIF